VTMGRINGYWDREARRWGTRYALLAHRPRGYRSKYNLRINLEPILISIDLM
jgi:hypothetical protein